MSNNPTSSSDDASSISNQPLIPKASEPKDYEAAAATLMASYGFSGGIQAVPAKPPKKNKTKTKSASSNNANAGQSSSSNATSSNNASKK